MPRVDYPSVRDTAAEILREVEAEHLVKQAEHQMLRDVTHPATEVGEGMRKIARALRALDDEDPAVTYDDIQNFIARCGHAG
jgi:hypothetical protein